jgi:hypothetical protein
VQIMAHSARTFSTPRNRNWRKPRACLICPNTGSPLPFSIGRVFRSRHRRFFRIRWVSGPPIFPFAVVGRLASGRDIAIDALCFECFEIGFAAVAGVRRGLIRLAAEIVLDGLDQGHQLALIVAALRQSVGARQ